jgi:glycosyltransferase involved in cell wall biosynthesis
MNRIILFTHSYPYGNGETFVENELETLTKHFDRVEICPANGDGEPRSSFNKTIPVLRPVKSAHSRPLSVFFKLEVLLKEVLSRGFHWSRMRYEWSLIENAYDLAQSIERLIATNEIASTVYYAYWMDDWVSALGLLKREGRLKHLVCRAHRFDLYESQNSLGFIPLRMFQLSAVDEVHCIANDGCAYMEANYPSFKPKFKLSRLGTPDNGLNEQSIPQRFHLVSCSGVRPVKRVDLIARAVAEHGNMKWTHLGGGKDFSKLQNLVESFKSSDVEIDLKGDLSNDEVHAFLKREPISAFINVSSSEGLPVSLMEAASYGIPLIATDVGGTKEIIDPSTCILLSSNPEISQIREAFDWINQNSSLESRASIRSFWQMNFSADTNYRSFASRLIEIIDNRF